MATKKKPGKPAEASSIEGLVLGIKGLINNLVAEECDPIPPGCGGSPGTGTYEDLAHQVQEANSSRKKIITDIKKDFNKLATELGY